MKYVYPFSVVPKAPFGKIVEPDPAWAQHDAANTIEWRMDGIPEPHSYKGPLGHFYNCLFRYTLFFECRGDMSHRTQ